MGQEFPDASKAVLTQQGNLAPGVRLRTVGRQGFGIGRVQIKQFEFVARPQQPLADEGRAGVDLEAVGGFEWAPGRGSRAASVND